MKKCTVAVRFKIPFTQLRNELKTVPKNKKTPLRVSRAALDRNCVLNGCEMKKNKLNGCEMKTEPLTLSTNVFTLLL